MKRSGIYKITNPNGKVYIGQSVDLDKRLRVYKNVNNAFGQPKIFESLNQHGSDSHQYEILELCDCGDLDLKERNYKEQFVKNNGWEKALFCWLNDPPTREERRARQNKTIQQSKKTCSKRKVYYKTIYQYDLDGKFIREWDNDKLHLLENSLRIPILKCAKDKINIAFSYQWEDYKSLKIEQYKSNKNKAGVSKYKHLFD